MSRTNGPTWAVLDDAKIKSLKYHIKNYGSKRKLAEAAGVSRQTLYELLADESSGKQFRAETLVKICVALEIDPAPFLTNGNSEAPVSNAFEAVNFDTFYMVPYFGGKLAAGSGAVAAHSEQALGHIPVPRSMLSKATNLKNVQALEVKGDSMYPVITDGSFVCVDLGNVAQKDGIFAFGEGDMLHVKRLRFLGENVLVESENTGTNSAELKRAVDMRLIGRVICAWADL